MDVFPTKTCSNPECTHAAKWIENPPAPIACPQCSRLTCLQCLMYLKPGQVYTEKEIKSRCSRCFAPRGPRLEQTFDLNASLMARVTLQTAEEKSKREQENMKQMETMFAQFKGSVDMEEKEALKVFLKMMEGGPEVVPPEFRRSTGGPWK